MEMKTMLVYLAFGLGILGFIAFFLDNNGVPKKIRQLSQWVLRINLVFVIIILILAIVN
jgi:hypothetical protein